MELRVIQDEMDRFEQEERRRLGLDKEKKHWVDPVPRRFGASEKETTTLMVSGLTMAQDIFVAAALGGLGYKLQHLDCPDNDALRFGKEFGNRGQCNPTYFTVGNLVKHLSQLRDSGLSVEEITRNYVFLTAGACGPCRFGMYATEYRKALRDAGFPDFRVILFQQTGGLKQATGEGDGLKMDPPFFIGILRALMAGDVLNALGYRIRPYEVEPGATDRALAECRSLVVDAFRRRDSVLWALWKCRKILGAVQVDRSQVKARVSIIGEFWAMTTEGDGNYQLQRFLESEGAECEIQLVTAWLLYNIWSAEWDTRRRMDDVRGLDKARRGLFGVNTRKKLFGLKAAELALRACFKVWSWAAGLYDYPLPDMHQVAAAADGHYNHHLRGGEGHMEVGKLILNVKKKKCHMTLSVKPFGCMPSSSVSDGVQSLVTEKYPEAIFCPVETSGDGAANFYSRVQMYLFKARAMARNEVDAALASYDMSMADFQAALKGKIGSALFRAPHAGAGTTADLVHYVGRRLKA